MPDDAYGKKIEKKLKKANFFCGGVLKNTKEYDIIHKIFYNICGRARESARARIRENEKERRAKRVGAKKGVGALWKNSI